MAAALISTCGVNLVQPFAAPAYAAVLPPPKPKLTKDELEKLNAKILRSSFEQSGKLSFGGLGWGDAETKLLSRELFAAKSLTKLFLNGNAITDEGVAALVASLRKGDAPKLKVLDLAGNPKISDKAKQALSEAREGLSVSVATPPAAQNPSADSEGVRKLKSAKIEKERVAALYTFAFEQSEALFFSDIGWGDAEAKVLTQALPTAKNLKKLYLNGNLIQCDGSAAIAASLRAGDAPKLKVLNLAGNKGITETDKRELRESRKGLDLSFAYKQTTDAPVYLAADEGRLKPARVVERAQNTIKGEGQPLVEGSSATCVELKEILDVDKAALNLQKNKLNSKAGRLVYENLDPAKIKEAEELEKALSKQIAKLEKKLEAKTQKYGGC